jgi:translation initiation factor IF-2
MDLTSRYLQLLSDWRPAIRLTYDCIDDVKEGLGELLAPEVVETDLGRLVIRAIFKTTKTEVICGGEVTKGRLVVPALARVVRDDKVLAEVEVTNLKRGPQDVKEVLEGEMCGLSFRSVARVELQEGDRIELFTRETVLRKL